MTHIRKRAASYIGAGCGIGLLAALWLMPSRDRSGPISDLRVRRLIADGKREQLPVYAITVNETLDRIDARLPRQERTPILLIDFKVDGQTVTFWVWDSPVAGGDRREACAGGS